MNNKPICIIVTGRPGVGKTTFSKRLSQKLWMPVISRDEIKEGYVNTFSVKHDQLPSEANGIVSDFFLEIVNQYLLNDISIIVEAAFQHKVWKEKLPKITELSRPFIIVCSVDGTLAAKRHLQRGLDDPRREFYHGDKRVSIYRQTGMTPSPGEYTVPKLDVPTVHVQTEREYSPSIDEVIEQIQNIYQIIREK